ncbi:Synaptic vesicular amine transporter [Halotydeus destructor]|nr:Synaptic vesicular amine transporter [Halotydeus destructor]
MTQESESTPQTFEDKVIDVLRACRGSRKLVILIVAVALLLDNMLLTSVVPIIPAFLFELHHKADLIVLNETLRTSTHSPAEQFSERMSYLNKEQPSLLPSPQAKLRHEELVNENFEVGIMFACKPIVQAIANPFVGVFTNRIGYSVPMFAGFIIMFFSTLIFAVGETFPTLFIARCLQGVGSACTSVAGMGMLAERYPNDRERGNAMAIALGGLALGVLIGPPFGGLMYQYIGKGAPFIILAILALADGLLQLLVLQPKISKEEQEGASLMTLIKDPYILVAAGAITFANAGIATLEPSLPLWMMDTMNANNWEQGAAFLPASISYLIGTNIFGPLGHRMGRWLASMVAIISIGLALLCIPMANSIDDLILPNSVIGFAIGMVDSSMMPMLGYLVDIRHTSVYGSVYAIGDVAFCAGFVIGPTLSGSVGRYLGFQGLVWTVAFICFAFAPFLFLLRNPPILNEGQDQCVRYVNYSDDTPDEDTQLTKPMQQAKLLVP